jgi:hypothetical protein
MKISKKQIQEKPGIYLITNLINNKVYIGQSKNVYRRGIYHRFELNHNKHSNSHLQYSFNKYGKENFSFSIIEYCFKEKLTEKEKYYISIQKTELYNVKDASDSVNRSFKKLSNEHKLKISKSLKGKVPENIIEFRKAKLKKIAYYIDNKLIKIFESCVEAADFFKITPKLFNYYIGKERKQKSKYFSKNTKLEYYE